MEKIMNNSTAAALAYNEQRKANEVKAYSENIDGKIKMLELEIDALKGLAEVCTEFDGKVINKRFHDTVELRTGFNNKFDAYSFDLRYYGDGYNYNNHPHIHIIADWNNKTNETKWVWGTNDRMNAGKARIIIESEINRNQERIAYLTASKKQYGEYLEKARQAESIIKELNGYSYEIRDWAKGHDLNAYCGVKYIWQ